MPLTHQGKDTSFQSSLKRHCCPFPKGTYNRGHFSVSDIPIVQPWLLLRLGEPLILALKNEQYFLYVVAFVLAGKLDSSNTPQSAVHHHL